jgi:urease accessory protein
MTFRQLARRSLVSVTAVMAAGVVAASPAAAHPGHEARLGGWLDGFLHPFVGLDHLAAMAAVGAIAVLAHRRLPIWAAPAAFVSAMVVAGGLGFAGVEFGAVELAIAASVLFGGLALLAAKQVPLGWWLLPAVALAGAAHGNAHGLEAPAVATPVAYVAGFVLATALLHAAGAVVGVAMRRVDLGRVVGGAALFGIALVTGA